MPHKNSGGLKGRNHSSAFLIAPNVLPLQGGQIRLGCLPGASRFALHPRLSHHGLSALPSRAKPAPTQLAAVFGATSRQTPSLVLRA